MLSEGVAYAYTDVTHAFRKPGFELKFLLKQH
jgi:hypothetical protein